jgi:hypothetical protein
MDLTLRVEYWLKFLDKILYEVREVQHKILIELGVAMKKLGSLKCV